MVMATLALPVTDGHEVGEESRPWQRNRPGEGREDLSNRRSAHAREGQENNQHARPLNSRKCTSPPSGPSSRYKQHGRPPTEHETAEQHPDTEHDPVPNELMQHCRRERARPRPQHPPCE